MKLSFHYWPKQSQLDAPFIRSGKSVDAIWLGIGRVLIILKRGKR